MFGKEEKNMIDAPPGEVRRKRQRVNFPEILELIYEQARSEWEHGSATDSYEESCLHGKSMR